MRFLIYLFLLAATFYRCFWNIEMAPIERWDEQTNISVVSDTRSHHSFPILFLSNEPFFEKPPLWYYLNILLPTNPRIFSAITGFFVILLTAFVAWKWWGWVASVITWSILLATNHLFITNPAGIFSTHTFRSADMDSLFILFLVATIATKNPTLRGVFTGLAILTKGPLGVLPLLLFPGSWRVAIAIVIPWYLFMTILFGMPFLSEHVGYHSFSRMLTPMEGHNNPVWYYVNIITNRAFFPLWELLVLSLLWIGKTRRDTKAIAVALLTILFFLIPTIARTRLAWYILPMYPFAALTIGAALKDFLDKKEVFVSNKRQRIKREKPRL